MNKAFELILERLEEAIKECKELQRNTDYAYGYMKMKKGLNYAKEIVQEVAEEYSYLSKGFDNGLLKRIADYFSSVYDGDDKTAPKMELSVYDLRYIASLNVEKCRLQTEINNIKKSHEEYNNGWIACSERLPEEAFGCLVTVMDCEPSTQTDSENILPYFVGYDGHRWNDANGEEIPFEVVAWQPLPESYKPEGE